jgi:hypothetical protein
MRFRPSGGLQSRPDKNASEARAEATGDQAVNDQVFEHRHQDEIERAENLAAGLPPGGTPEASAEPAAPGKKDFRRPNLETPAEVKEFEPVPVPEPQPQGIVETLKAAANKVLQKVQRMIRPEKRTHKTGGVHDRAIHGGAAGRQHFQRQGAEPGGRPEGGVRRHRF